MRIHLITLLVLPMSLGLATAAWGATFTFPIIPGPTNVVSGAGTTLNLNDAINTAGGPVGPYTSYDVTADWVAGGGNPWSSEARIDLVYSSASTGLLSATSGAAGDSNPTTLGWTGFLPADYTVSPDATLDLILEQTWGGSDADWSNISVTLGMDPRPLLSDESIGTLIAGSVVSGDTSLSTDVLNGAAGFGSGSWSGGDDVYTLNWGGPMLGSETLLEFTNANGDLDLFLWDDDAALSGPILTSLSTSDNESIDISGLSAGTYWVHIDGWQGDSNVYTLSVQVIPEPGTLALAALFGLSLTAIGMRKRLG